MLTSTNTQEDYGQHFHEKQNNSDLFQTSSHIIAFYKIYMRYVFFFSLPFKVTIEIMFNFSECYRHLVLYK